jgi:nucleoside-diphosphate kinase
MAEARASADQASMSASRVWISAMRWGSMGRFGLGHEARAFGIRGSTVSRSEVAEAGTSCATPPMRARDGQADLAPFERQLAPDQAEERGLARAVAADEAHLVAIGDEGRGALEKRPAGHGEADVVDCEHGRGLWCGREGVNRGFPRDFPHATGAPDFAGHGASRTRHEARDMATERTLSIIKPDATKRNLTGKINAKFEEAGLRIVAQKRVHLTKAQAGKFYEVHKERPFYDELCEFMASGPVVVQVLEGDDAIAKNREVMGATNPANAAPGTVRAEFAESVGENSVHGSDAPETAAQEIAYFFAGIEIVG